jgi:hypothetical protein
MKRTFTLFALLAFSALVSAQETPAPARQEPAKTPAAAAVKPATAKPAPATADSPLVAAAKKAKGGKVQAGTVITNDNMKGVKGPGGSVTYANPGDPNAPAYTPDEGAAPGGGRTREDWKSLISSARGAVSNLESRIASLQSQANKLANDFYAWDDPAYRDSVIKPAWDQALASLEEAKNALPDAKQRVADIEEEARKAGVPPGWLR